MIRDMRPDIHRIGNILIPNSLPEKQKIAHALKMDTQIKPRLGQWRAGT